MFICIVQFEGSGPNAVSFHRKCSLTYVILLRLFYIEIIFRDPLIFFFKKFSVVI